MLVKLLKFMKFGNNKMGPVMVVVFQRISVRLNKLVFSVGFRASLSSKKCYRKLNQFLWCYIKANCYFLFFF